MRTVLSFEPFHPRRLAALAAVFVALSVPARAAGPASSGQSTTHLWIAGGVALGLLVQLLVKLLVDVPQAQALVERYRKDILAAVKVSKIHEEDPEALLEGLSNELSKDSFLRPIIVQTVHAARGGDSLSAIEAIVSGTRQHIDATLQKASFLAISAVYIGLLGTILGLSAAVVELQAMSSLVSGARFQEFEGQLRSMLGSFGWAFGSAASGILVTLILGRAVDHVERRTSALISSVNELFILGLAPAARQVAETFRPTDEPGLIRQLISEMDSTLLHSIEGVEKIQESAIEATKNFQQATLAVDSFATRLTSVSDAVVASTATFADEVGRLSRSNEMIGQSLTDTNKALASMQPVAGAVQQYVQAADGAVTALESAAHTLEATGQKIDVMPTTLARQSDAYLQQLVEQLSKTAEACRTVVERSADVLKRQEAQTLQVTDAFRRLSGEAPRAGGSRSPESAADPEASRLLIDIREELRNLGKALRSSTPASSQPGAHGAELASAVNQLSSCVQAIVRLESSLASRQRAVSVPVAANRETVVQEALNVQRNPEPVAATVVSVQPENSREARWPWRIFRR